MSTLAEVTRVVAGPDGRFSFKLPPGISRTFRVGFRAAATDVALACSPTVALRVRAGVTLKAKPRSVRYGRTTRFSGRVLGTGLPPRGKLVDLQAYEGRWRTFKTVRTRPSGDVQREVPLHPRQPHPDHPLPCGGPARGALPLRAGDVEDDQGPGQGNALIRPVRRSMKAAASTSVATCALGAVPVR